MNAIAVLAALFLAVTFFVHVASMSAVVAWRRSRAVSTVAPASHERVSLVRPVCGLDEAIERSLRDGFRLAHPDYEILFCAHSESDAAVAFVRALMAEHKSVAARLLVGDDPISPNPKLNNMVKGWHAADAPWVVFCDDNVLLPRDYIARLMAARTPQTGVVTSIQLGSEPRGCWGDVECAFLNGIAARWYFVAAATGQAFVHGKTMMVSRAELERAGGIACLVSELAEDAALTKLMRRRGRAVSVLHQPLEQPIGRRTAAEVAGRQLRWARLRRDAYTFTFLTELFAGGFFPALALWVLADALGWPKANAIAIGLAVWYGSEMAFLACSRWPISLRTVPASILRDITLPFIWLLAWRRGGRTSWRGKAVYGPQTS